MSLQIEQLSARYGKIPALHDVSASATPGAVTAVLGPNAAGKSTLLGCIVGAIRPHRGRVRIDGREAHRLSARRMARSVAFVPQRSTVAAPFSVRQVVELGRYALSPDSTRVEASIERLQLQEIADRPYPALSVGQQQRVTLARALAQLESGGHLILDEPLSAMDLAHAHDAVELLKELAAAGSTVVIALHDVSLAAAFADEVWLLSAGALVAAGPAGDILIPDRLEAVFSVPFRRLVDEDGVSVLVPLVRLARAPIRSAGS